DFRRSRRDEIDRSDLLAGSRGVRALESAPARGEGRRIEHRREGQRQHDRHGRIRTRRPVEPMSEPPHSRQADPRKRSRRLAGPSQQASRKGQLAIHHRRRPRKAQEALPLILNDSGDWAHLRDGLAGTCSTRKALPLASYTGAMPKTRCPARSEPKDGLTGGKPQTMKFTNNPFAPAKPRF